MDGSVLMLMNPRPISTSAPVGRTDFDISSVAFSYMVVAGDSAQLRSHGEISLLYRSRTSLQLTSRYGEVVTTNTIYWKVAGHLTVPVTKELDMRMRFSSQRLSKGEAYTDCPTRGIPTSSSGGPLMSFYQSSSLMIYGNDPTAPASAGEFLAGGGDEACVVL